MRTFLKINYISALYAFVLFIQTEITINVYRLERITGLASLDTYVGWINLIIFVVSSLLLYALTKCQISHLRVKYITTILWLAYYYIFVRIFAELFPITNPQEKPLGGVGLVILGMIIVYPFYIALINFVSSIKTSEMYKE